jgi:hypothetical protein
MIFADIPAPQHVFLMNGRPTWVIGKSSRLSGTSSRSKFAALNSEETKETFLENETCQDTTFTQPMPTNMGPNVVTLRFNMTATPTISTMDTFTSSMTTITTSM